MKRAIARLALARPLPPKCDYHPTFLRVRFRVILSERSERRISCYGAPGEILRRYAPQNDTSAHQVRFFGAARLRMTRTVTHAR